MLFRSPQADVLLLDKQHLAEFDIRQLQAIRHYASEGRVVLLLDRADRRTAEVVLLNGFHGYLLMARAAVDCAKAIRAVAQGDIWLPRAALASVLGSWLKAGRAPALALPAAETNALTSRERQILTQLKKGLSNKQIAQELGVLEDTIKKHLQHVYNKLGIRRRTLLLARDLRP